MDKRFESILKRRDLNPEHYLPVFSKCNSYTKLKGEDYWVGMSLHEFGLMEMKRVPVFNNNGSYIGVYAFFKSMFENTDNEQCDHYFARASDGNLLPCDICGEQKPKCPFCQSEKVFQVVLTHSKCKSCNEKWTN